MSSAWSKRRIGVWSLVGVVLVISVLTLWLNRNSFSLRTPNHFSLPSRRGHTVQNLQIIKSALRSYQQAHGRLPGKLNELGLATKNLVDGAGREFVYTNRYMEKGYAPGQGETLVVGMSAPTGHFPFDPEKWRYAIVQTKNGEFAIRGTSDPERLRP